MLVLELIAKLGGARLVSEADESCKGLVALARSIVGQMADTEDTNRILLQIDKMAITTTTMASPHQPQLQEEEEEGVQQQQEEEEEYVY